jgi:hypothetical protein
MPHAHAQNDRKESHPTHHKIIWGIGIAAATLSLAPYILPLVGLGDAATLSETQSLIHPHNNPIGVGLAGGINHFLSNVPGIGTSLATGTWFPIAMSAAIGIGGVMLANWIEKNNQGNVRIRRFSNLIRNSALITSALIAMPTLLTGITTGLAYIALALGDMGQITTFLQQTIGVIGTHTTNATILGATIPHLLLCGASLLPVGAAYLFNHQSFENKTNTHQPIRIEWVKNSQQGLLQFRLINSRTNQPMSQDALEVTHTQRLHCMIIDENLRDYHHLHPKYDAATKIFSAPFSPNAAKPYTAWVEFTLAANNYSTQIRSQIPNDFAPYSFTHNTSATTETGLRLQRLNPAPVVAGKEAEITLTLRDKNGNAMTSFEPIMGAYGHLVGFSHDGNAMIHCHPMSDAYPENGQLTFHITPEHAGNTRFFLQIQQNGQQHTLPFDIHIQKAQEKSASNFTTRLHAENYTKAQGLPAVFLA